ncbi:TPA: hypothetical protein ACXOGX_000886 [Stenotrophomonas maltophilia]
MDYAIHQDAATAAMSQFSAWGQHALVSEAHPPVHKSWTQSVSASGNSGGSRAAVTRAGGEITTVDSAETTPASAVVSEKPISRDGVARISAGTSEVARKRSRMLATRYAQGDGVTTEVEARLQILSAQLEKLSPRVSASQVEQLERVAKEAGMIASRREERAARLAALLGR